MRGLPSRSGEPDAEESGERKSEAERGGAGFPGFGRAAAAGAVAVAVVVAARPRPGSSDRWARLAPVPAPPRSGAAGVPRAGAAGSPS
jgi:hypothetical protein